MKLLAITTRGLELLSAEEMAEIPHLRVIETAYRRVVASYDGPPEALLNLRVVDDIYLLLDAWTGILRQRESLQRMKELSARLDLKHAAAILPAEGKPVGRPAFSVTASFVGKRNYSADEIKKAVAEGVTGANAWVYSENDQPGARNLRVFIEHEQALVGLRLSDHPMHQRPYKQAHVFGSTKPTVAAAMVRLAQITPGATVLDPCCGAGTIIIEAALAGARASGGDIDPEAVQASRQNIQLAGITAEIQTWDARRLPLPDGSAVRVICNLPWGRQVSSAANLDEDYRAIGAEIRRVLASGGRVVLLANAPEQVQIPGMALKEQVEISLFGQNPKILIFE